MASAAGDLIVRLGAETRQFDSRMRAARHQIRATGAATTRMGTTMAGGFATAAAGARTLTAALAPILGPILGITGLMQLVRSGEEFNRKMRSSLAIMEATETQQKEMRRAAFEVGKTTRYAASEAAEAFYFLASAGLRAEQTIGALPTVAKFAQAGNFDLARATDILTDAQSALGLASKDTATYMKNMNRVANVTVKAATKANASVEQFGEALMNKGALGAKLVGMELEEAMAILMVFADKGFAKGVEGGQALWMALRDLKTKAVENEAAFKALGIHVDAGGGKFAAMADIVEDLDKAFAGLAPLEIQKKLATLGIPSKSLAPILTLLGTAPQLREYHELMKNAGDTMEKVAAEQMTPFQKGWREVKTAVTEAGTALTDTLGPDFAETLKSAASAIEILTAALGPLIDTYKELKEMPVVGELMERSMRGGLPSREDWEAAKEVLGMKKTPAAAAATGKEIGAAPEEAARAAALAPSPLIGLLERRMGKVLEAGEKAIEAARRRATSERERIMRRGQAITEQFETPGERFRRQIAEINRLFRAGAIDVQTMRRAHKGYWEEYQPPAKREEFRLAGAMERGSAEAWKTIFAAMRPARDPQEQMAGDMREAKGHMRRAADGIERIEGKEPDLVVIQR